MAPKKITVERVGVKLSNDNEFYFWLSKKQVESLVDSEGDEVVGFESLDDGGTYKLGPPQQQQPLRNPTESGLLEDVRYLKKLVIESTVKESRAVSYAEYYEEKLREERVESWNPQPQETIELPAFLNQAAVQTGGEKSVVKPCWKDLLEKHEILPPWSNAYEIAHLGTKIPDIALFPRGLAKPSDSDFVAAGDCKGNTWTGTSSSEKGQVMLYVHRMLDAQPMRQFGFGFVTNNRILLIVKGYRDDASPFLVRWCISSVLTFERGMKLWLQLLRQDTGYRRPPVVENFQITFHETLRPGGQCRAFGSTYRGRPVVAKLYSHEDVARDSAERTARAANIVAEAAETSDSRDLATLPEVVATEGRWSLISPKGIPLTRENFVKVHVDKLVRVLQVVHRAGIIHRDVRVSNIFHLNMDQVLLNDWGSSAPANELVMYAGAPEPHIHPLISTAELYRPTAKHDLYALVSSVAQLLSPGVNIESRKVTFKDAFQAADSCNYESVIFHLTNHMR